MRDGSGVMFQDGAGSDPDGGHEHAVVLVTPVWKPEPDDDESWNVRRTRAAAPEPAHFFVGPVGLDPRPWLALSPRSRFLPAAPRHFSGVWEYSRMMLDARFYERFASWRHMLLVQTDAFLVRDPTVVLARASWDYAGAPWSEPYPMSAATVYSRRLGEALRPVLDWRTCTVGNGGLSARRIDAFVRLLRRRPFLRRAARTTEDLVVSYLGERGRLTLASEREAGRLFFERSVSGVPDDVYGYHALRRFHPDSYSEIRGKQPDPRPC